MKTALLTGAALNWAVAEAEGFFKQDMASIRNGKVDVFYFDGYEPAVDWALAGAIIEREKIALHFNGDSPWVGECGWARRDGATPLEAAMRSYVAVKLGDDVEIPEELLK